MSTVAQGGDITLFITIYEYAGGPVFDPSDLDLVIKNPQDVTVVTESYPGGIVRQSVGIYKYTFDLAEDAPLGEWQATWTAIINSVPRTGIEDFDVVEHGDIDPGVGTVTLTQSQTITFAGVINPLYIDPEELTTIFTEATYLEAAEAIYHASLDLQAMLKLNSTELPADPLAYEYVKAAAACALTKVYGNASLDADSDAVRMRLGDLEVQKGSGTFASSRSKISPETASTWCELAGALRKLILFKSTGMKAVVKGSNYMNPIPRRHLKPDSGNWPSRRHQGDLDDEPAGRIR